MAKSAFEGALAFGRWTGGIRGPLKSYRATQLAKFFDSGSSLRLQYPREDLGFVYGPGGAVCADSDADSAGLGSTTEGLQPGAVKDGKSAVMERGAPYVPNTAPGARLPHVAMKLHGTGADCKWCRVPVMWDGTLH